jgi:hypothetical protein
LMDDDIQICSDDRSIGRSIVKHLGREKWSKTFRLQDNQQEQRYIKERETDRQAETERREKRIQKYKQLQIKREREKD